MSDRQVCNACQLERCVMDVSQRGVYSMSVRVVCNRYHLENCEMDVS
jgi:hypothetical protein